MEIVAYPNAADFISKAGHRLTANEARYGLFYGIARLVAVNPHYYGTADPWFCSVNDGTEICAVAMCTPPYNVGLALFSGHPATVSGFLIRAAYKQWPVIPGAIGDRELVEPFIDGWCRLTGASIKSSMAQRIYRLDTVNDPSPVPGRLRLATTGDRNLVADWTDAFNRDTFGADDDSIPGHDITPEISKGNIYLWDHDGPASMAARCRPTDHGTAVGYVYTPPELRRHGYATACVAGVCREIFKSGHRFCTLYTDLANPTSNSIYIKIGFQPVGDSVNYTLSSPNL